jgi:Holliday junction resolvasome RuvABC endonuclease subunit
MRQGEVHGDWNGRAIAFDQSLASTGYVLFTFDGSLQVEDMGMIKTSSTFSGWTDNFYRAQWIYTEVVNLFGQHKLDLVLHEMPPIGGSPFLRRPDASIVAATAIQCAASHVGLEVKMVSAQVVKKYLTGNYRAEKKGVREALLERFGTTLQGHKFSLNEHTYDALGIAVTYVETQ